MSQSFSDIIGMTSEDTALCESVHFPSNGHGLLLCFPKAFISDL